MKKIDVKILLLLAALAFGFVACSDDDDDPEPTPTTSKVVTVQGDLTGAINWTADKQYLLSGFVYVTDGATLTIAPGTIIKGDKASMGTLIVERGGKIIAEGTQSNPIIFTSNGPQGFRNRGDWGGIVICGKAPVNNGDPQIEGGPRSHYGGDVATDNSGILKYVRIEFAGYPFQPDKEINGLTMAGVGSGTTIDYVQVSFSNDDAYEWFGGTVNAKHIIAQSALDDDFDSDNGWNGMVQFALSMRDRTVADVSGSNGFESDNDATGSDNAPQTSPIFSNVSIFGPLAKLTTSNVSGNYKNSMHLRRNTALKVYNSLFVGHPNGLLLDGSKAENNAKNGALQIRNSILSGNKTFFSVSSSSTTMTSQEVADWFLTSEFANDTIVNNSSLGLNDPFTLTNPQLLPAAGSMLLEGGSFTNENLQNSFFSQVNFRGAFGTENWASGWTNFDPNNADYEAK